MTAAIALFAVNVATIAVRPGYDGCPSSAEVERALRARLPGAFAGRETQDILTVAVGAAEDGAVRLSIVDARGGERLRREWPARLPALPRTCAALADTIALVVERYLEELDAGPPPRPAPGPQAGPGLAAAATPPAGAAGVSLGAANATPPPVRAASRAIWDVGVGGGWRPGESCCAAVDAYVRMTRALGRGHAVFSLLSGVAGGTDQSWSGGTGTLRRLPVELALWLRLPAGPGDLLAGPSLGADLVWFDAQSGGLTQTVIRVSPITGGSAAFRLPVAGWGFVRLVSGFGVALVKYDFVAPDPVFGTARAHAKVGIEAGLAFR